VSNIAYYLKELEVLKVLIQIYAVWLSCRINEEFRDVKLTDLRILATLGVGGFGRVELVQIVGDPTKSFALKQMKKSQVQHLQTILSV
jgi:hypothetical protein